MTRATRSLLVALAILPLIILTATSCRSTPAGKREQRADEVPPLSPAALGEGEKLRVVATTSIVADVVQNIGGDLIDLTRLMPLGADPHAFEPTPQDVTAVTDAHVTFINGAGLETFLETLLDSVGGDVTVVPVSSGVELLQLGDRGEGLQHNAGADPHTWLDPNNVIVWTRNIERALSTLDPHNADTYAANARAYRGRLVELDAWIQEQLSQVPRERRKLVTDHRVFGYFAHQYGLEQIGAAFPGYSTLSEPSAQDLAALEDTIRKMDVGAVFVGTTVSADLVARVAEDTGAQLISLYTGSLSEPGGPADDYLSLMRYNVQAMAEGLR